jgi:hypothetical protein
LARYALSLFWTNPTRILGLLSPKLFGLTISIVPIIGTAIAGCAIITIWISIQVYLVDAFTTYAVSAVAANTILRSVFGAFLPLAGQPLYDALGLGWGNSLLAFIALAMIPTPWVFLRYGEVMRKRWALEL